MRKFTDLFLEDQDRKVVLAGTFQITDAADNVWTLQLNADESAILELNNQERKYYCFIGKYSCEKAPYLQFDTDDEPISVFPAGPKRIFQPYIYDGFIYADENALKSKNPNKRLPITKL